MIFIKSGRYRVQIYRHANGRSPFVEWTQSLDGATRARINARIARFEDGNFGDHKSVGDGVVEARFFFGPGYRVYFSTLGDQIIMLLIGGNKTTQIADVVTAKEVLKLYLEDLHANKKS
jgi:putative addiction module killer protein